MHRRSFLRLGLGGAAILAAQPILGRDPALAQPAPGPFGHGVASGDPLPDRVILWTRVTPDTAATPGSGLGASTAVGWEVARDAAFTSVVASGTVTTSAAADHTVKVDAAGLPAGTDLWYRFRALGTTSPVGRTRTAPAPGAALDRLRLGVVSCSSYEDGYFGAYRHLAARDDLDLVLHLGDYIYEYGRGGGEALGRGHDPAHEIVTLEDYRRRHALHKTDPDLAALHQRYAFVTTIDDHEVTNNSWSDGAENHQPDEGDYAARHAAAMQAYFEWMPIRPAGVSGDPTRIHRALSFGALADLIVLDERTHRDHQVTGLYGDVFVTDPAVGDPQRTMLGADQLRWLDTQLTGSTATWKVLGNSVMFAPLVLADLPDVPGVTPALQEVLAGAGLTLPLVINADQWDGYRAEQELLRDRFGEVGGVVVLTGDIHSSWAAEIPADPGTYLPVAGRSSVAVEFVTPAVTSDSFSAIITGVGIPGGEVLATQIPLVVTTAGPWFKYVDAERQGFGVFEVTAQAAQYDWFYLSDRTDPAATAIPGPSWRSPAGSNRLEPASPLGPRPGPASAPAPSPSPSGPAPVPAGTGAPTGGGGGSSGRPLPATGAVVPLAAGAAAAVAGLSAGAIARRAAGAAVPEEEAAP